MGKSREIFAKNNAILWVFLVMLSNNLLILPVLSATNTIIDNNNYGNEKNYYSSPADPHVTTPSSGSHHHGSHHKPPSKGGSGGYYPSPTPTPPSGGGGGTYNPPLVPSPPIGGGSGGGCSCPTPTTPSLPPPTGGGGGSYYPPTTPVSPSTPLVPSPPFITPIVPTPPTFPISPPTPFDPNTPPFPCTYWGSHPALIFGALGWWATLGGIMGVATLPGLGTSSTSLQQVLNNPRNDGYGSLYREGAASYLNSMATKNFYFTTPQVKDGFLSSLNSEKAAARQARLFKLANEGKLKKFV
ncbi:uncharacterized protein LOC141610792 [Silene latifolia]|uniref:uncharacterized protein LOC141610792 n=1 Tax=Silene latifolia TaxID=37657 RepID=UPI003D780E0F